MMRDIQLHEDVEISYVVDGWLVKYSPDDGNTWEEFKGETPLDALEACFESTRNQRGR
ncbi:MAG TPA: hypothetical protein VGN72_05015 [Tepidisphaeraceae bacterium]|jgi:hypothetical protein|nr:hypothetical protein [Tepidisphaeraceae bacterium]